jgi:transposase
MHSLKGMAAYSIDLRQKILHASERGLGSQRALPHLFGVSLAFVEKVLRQHRQDNEISDVREMKFL